MITSQNLHPSVAATRITMGQLTVTLKSKRTGEHITLRLRAKNRDLKKRYPNFDEGIILVCDAGRGPDRGDKVGFLKLKGRDNECHANKGADSKRFWAFKMTVDYLLTGRMHPEVEFKVEDFCGHCGRPLNDPISIDRGFGPVCFGKETGSKHVTREPKVMATESNPDGLELLTTQTLATDPQLDLIYNS